MAAHVHQEADMGDIFPDRDIAIIFKIISF